MLFKLQKSACGLSLRDGSLSIAFAFMVGMCSGLVGYIAYLKGRLYDYYLTEDECFFLYLEITVLIVLLILNMVLVIGVVVIFFSGVTYFIRIYKNITTIPVMEINYIISSLQLPYARKECNTQENSIMLLCWLVSHTLYAVYLITKFTMSFYDAVVTVELLYCIGVLVFYVSLLWLIIYSIIVVYSYMDHVNASKKCVCSDEELQSLRDNEQKTVEE